MPADVAESHNLLSRELLFLNTKWNDYKMLYCTDDDTIQLLDDAASFFFQIVREVFRDDIVLSVCRLTDPAISSVRGVRRNNLTIEHLISTIASADSSLHKTLNSMLPTFKSRCAKFRRHRNRRVGHHDLDTRLKRPHALLPRIEIKDTDEALEAIADVLNAVEMYFDGNQQSYNHGIYGSGGCDEMLECLRDEKKLRRYFNHKEFGDPM
jgi:hypothetical protein